MPVLSLAFLIASLGSPQGDRDAAAHEILAALEGEWRFELAGRTGTRTVRTVFPSILVAWSEQFDGGTPLGEGLVGYDPGAGEFFSSSAHDVPGAYGMMTGQFDADTRTVTYEPLRLGPSETPYRAVFRMPGADAFTYTMLERGEDGAWTERWVARFERRVPSELDRP